ncbi:hypothetical protein D3C80_1974110 [compost metagenome]
MTARMIMTRVGIIAMTAVGTMTTATKTNMLTQAVTGAQVKLCHAAMTHRVIMSVTEKHVAYPTLDATNSGIRSMVTMF